MNDGDGPQPRTSKPSLFVQKVSLLRTHPRHHPLRNSPLYLRNHDVRDYRIQLAHVPYWYLPLNLQLDKGKCAIECPEHLSTVLQSRPSPRDHDQFHFF